MATHAPFKQRLSEAEAAIVELAESGAEEETVLKAVNSFRAELVTAGWKHRAEVNERFNCLLGSLGLIPSDNEGEPCD